MKSILSPAGREIHRKGIKPDYVVEIPATVLETGKANMATLKDPQYTQAIAVLKLGK